MVELIQVLFRIPVENEPTETRATSLGPSAFLASIHFVK